MAKTVLMAAAFSVDGGQQYDVYVDVEVVIAAAVLATALAGRRWRPRT